MSLLTLKEYKKKIDKELKEKFTKEELKKLDRFIEILNKANKYIIKESIKGEI